MEDKKFKSQMKKLKQAFKDEEKFVLFVGAGQNGGENIAVYTMRGMKIASLDTVPADMHQAAIVLPEGQVYIITINNSSFKWKH